MNCPTCKTKLESCTDHTLSTHWSHGYDQWYCPNCRCFIENKDNDDKKMEENSKA